MIARAVGGILVLLLAVAVAVLVPAGTVRYWRAWAYLALFAAATSLITAYLAAYDRALLARRLEGGPTAEREPRQRAISAAAGVAFLLVHVVAGLDRRAGWSAVPAVASVVADAVLAAGFAVVFLTFRANSFTSATVGVAEGQPLVDRGPYGVVRHPMYAGALLMLVATPVALGSWWAELAVIPLVAAIVARLLDEERYLCAHLRGYADYRRRVRHRLVPYAW